MAAFFTTKGSTMQQNALISLLQNIYHRQPEADDAVIERALTEQAFCRQWLFHSLGSDATEAELAVVLAIAEQTGLKSDLELLATIWQSDNQTPAALNQQSFQACIRPYPLSSSVSNTTVALWACLTQPHPAAELSQPIPEIRLGKLSSEDTAATIIQLASENMAQAALYGPDKTGVRLNSIRNNQQAILSLPPTEPFSVSLQRMISKALGLAVHHAEPLIVYRYRPGEEYKWHCDFIVDANASTHQELTMFGQRSDTVIFYLNDECSGGATCFKKWQFSVEPKAHSFVHFRNLTADGQLNQDSVHCGAPVESGEKWICTTWYRTKPMWHRRGLLTKKDN